MSISRNKLAGTASGIRRAKAAKWRQFTILATFAQLKPTYQMQPYSSEALDALENELCKPPRGPDEGIVSWTIHNASDLTRGPPKPKPMPADIIEKLNRSMEEILRLEDGDPGPWTSPNFMSRETLIKDLKTLRTGSRANAHMVPTRRADGAQYSRRCYNQ